MLCWAADGNSFAAMKWPAVEFVSAAFPKYADEDAELVNSACWGKRLAEYVAETLPRLGVPTEGLLCEDWGWLVSVSNEQFPLWIGCGVMGEPSEFEEDAPGETALRTSVEDESGLTEFSMFVVAEPGILKKLFRKIDTSPAVNRVVQGLKEMIAESDRFQNVEWTE